MLHLYFNEESDYSEENTWDNEVHHSPPQKETKRIRALAANVLHALLEQ